MEKIILRNINLDKVITEFLYASKGILFYYIENIELYGLYLLL